MIRVVAARFAQMLFVVFGISVIVFGIFFATPGADPAARIAGRNASQETLRQVRHEFGLDQALPVQYARMMQKLFVTGDLSSFVNRGLFVLPSIRAAAPVTLVLVAGAALFWLAGGVLIGVLAASFPNTPLDRLLMITGLIGVSMPVFWVGQMANLITQSRYHDTWLFSWVPGLGYKNFTDDPWLWFQTMIIPWVTLAVLYAGLYGRVLRASLIEAYQEDFIRTARAKGLGGTRIMLRHALRVSVVTLVSLFGLDFGALVGGQALLTEVVFGLQGMGKLLYDALHNLDLPIIIAVVMYASVFVVVCNAIVDIIHAILDPRVRAT